MQVLSFGFIDIYGAAKHKNMSHQVKKFSVQEGCLAAH
jgi:hypothetical protein